MRPRTRYRGTAQPLIATIAPMFGYVGLSPIQPAASVTLSRDARNRAGSQPYIRSSLSYSPDSAFNSVIYNRTELCSARHRQRSGALSLALPIRPTQQDDAVDFRCAVLWTMAPLRPADEGFRKKSCGAERYRPCPLGDPMLANRRAGKHAARQEYL
jgi:hypothetical protein